MDAYDVLLQINEILMKSGKNHKETLITIDDLVSEFFIQQRDELEE